MEFIRFCLQHKSIYQVIFMVKGVSVDEEEPVLAINRIRISIFKSIEQTLQDVFPVKPDPDRLLTLSRIYFFMLNGIINTYLLTAESLSDLMDRLGPTFEEALDTLLTGFQLQLTSED